MTQARQSRHTMIGTVIGSKMNKTITVRVETLQRHAKYGKYVRRRKKYYVHDEKEQAGDGDMVEIMACRPLSKTKRWRLVGVVQAALDRGVDVTGLAGAEEILGAPRPAAQEGSPS